MRLLALHAIAATANAHSWAARVDAKDAPAIRAALDGGQPFVAAGALSPEACDAWTDELMRTLGDVPCTQQIAGEPFDAPLAEFFYDALASTHAEPHFLFDEALLDGDLRDAAIAPWAWLHSPSTPALCRPVS